MAYLQRDVETEMQNKLLKQEVQSLQAQKEAAIDVIASHLKTITELTASRNELLALLEKLSDESRELSQYASYAQVVGGMSVNSAPVREWCDKVFVTLLDIEKATTDVKGGA
ncbi:MAG: hypothetical protein RIR18_419 [Pseudomonadota bacterium]|jgi:chromosome segregation ATPase